MITAFQVAIGKIYQRIKPERSRAYRYWIKRFACVSCSSTRNVDVSHTGAHGYGQRADDFDALPMCRKCHDAFGANPREFARVHDLDIPALIAFFNRLWQIKMERSA